MHKCNPLRWLWGLLPLCLLCWLAVLGMQQRIESELTARAREHLDRNNLSWASVVFKGRDGTIIGRAEEESDQRRPATEVAKLWGIRSLEDRIEVLQFVKNYVWNASTRDGILALTGYVPNEAARKAILTSARSAFPKHKVEDKMELARGAPEQKQWLGGTAFALRQLAALKPGGRAGLEASGLLVEGEADSSRAYETVRTALTRSLPQGISLKAERVIPPIVRPYVWGASLRGRQVELTGHAPSITTRDDLKAAAGRAFPGAAVVDRMTLAAGAPAEWQSVTALAIARLGQLKQGTAELQDRQLTVTGLTETEPVAEAVRASLKRDTPASFRLIEQVRQDPVAKAAEEARRAAEEAQREAARRKAEEDARRAAEAKAKADEEARRVADASRTEAERRAAEAKARAEEEARRTAELQTQQSQARAKAEAEARILAEQQRQQSEAARRKAEEDNRLAAEAQSRRLAEEKRIAEEQARVRRDLEERRRTEQAAQMRTQEAQRCQQSLTSAIESGRITFQRASAELDRRSHQTLNTLAKIVKSCPNFAIEVAGHTDNEGEPDRNQRLSERRAKSVLDYLVKAGVPDSSLSAAGYGDTRPKVANDSAANMAINRRIELSVKHK